MSLCQDFHIRAVVLAQLTERSLPILEVCCSIPVIGKIIKGTCLLLTVDKTKIKKNEAGNDSFKKYHVGNRPFLKLIDLLFWGIVK